MGATMIPFCHPTTVGCPSVAIPCPSHNIPCPSHPFPCPSVPIVHCPTHWQVNCTWLPYACNQSMVLQQCPTHTHSLCVPCASVQFPCGPSVLPNVCITRNVACPHQTGFICPSGAICPSGPACGGGGFPGGGGMPPF